MHNMAKSVKPTYYWDRVITDGVVSKGIFRRGEREPIATFDDLFYGNKIVNALNESTI